MTALKRNFRKVKVMKVNTLESCCISSALQCNGRGKEFLVLSFWAVPALKIRKIIKMRNKIFKSVVLHA